MREGSVGEWCEIEKSGWEKIPSGVQLSTNCLQLKIMVPDGKMRETECSNTETMFRILLAPKLCLACAIHRVSPEKNKTHHHPITRIS